MTLSIVKLTAHTYSGANKRPTSGNVEFSDGKFYGWSMHGSDEVVRFDVGYRKPSHGGWERKHFHTAKRSKLVIDHLNGNDVGIEVFKVRMTGE